jgi:hypothetical protein
VHGLYLAVSRCEVGTKKAQALASGWLSVESTPVHTTCGRECEVSDILLQGSRVMSEG